MSPGRTPEWDASVERLIALVRLGLAVGSLVVIWCDPTQPAKHWRVAYAAFGAYVGYSAIIWRLVASGPRPRLPLATQIVDLLWIVPVVYFTEAANSPFVVFFVTFTLFAGLRWGLWASWAVTAYSLLIYGSLLFVETPTPLNLNNDLMQLGYLLITGILGGYFAEYRRRRERELELLRGASSVISAKRGAPAALAATAAIVHFARTERLADAVVGVLRDPDDGTLLMVRGPDAVQRLGHDEAAPFFAAAGRRAADRPGPSIVLTDADQLLRFADAERAIAYPMHAGGDDLVGAVFFFFTEKPRLGRVRRHRRTDEEFLDLLLRQVIPPIETLYVLEQAPHARVMEERRRIARDVHDSFLQVLAALALRLDVLATVSVTEPVAPDLRELRDVLVDEQKRVRQYITDMRQPQIAGLGEAIERAVDAFRVRTRIAVDLALGPGLMRVPPVAVRELAPLVNEALTNVAKHARASHVGVTARIDRGDLELVVRDDGVGLEAAANASGYGLRSMRERAELLGGRVTIGAAQPSGTELVVSVPLPRAEAPDEPRPLRG